MKKQLQPQDPEQIPPILFIYLNQYGQLEVKTRLVLTLTEVAEVLTLGAQKVRWMVLRGELPSFHFGTRRVVSLEALEHYIRECEIDEQQERLNFLERYYGHVGFGKPHPEVQRAQERLNVMQQGQHIPLPEEQTTVPVSIEAALYHITITEAGRLECTPRWLLSLPEAAQLLGMSRSMLWSLSKQDDFPTFHIQRRAFVRVESLLHWIRTKEHPALEQAETNLPPTKNKKTAKTQTKKQRGG